MRQAEAPPQRRAFEESGAATAVSLHDPSCEKAILENPQIFQNCEIKIIIPLNMGGRVAAAALFVLVMKMDIEALPFSYAVGWLLMLLYELPLLVRFLRSSEM